MSTDDRWEQDDTDLLSLDLEYGLTVAHRLSCECAEYLVNRREVLIPAILEQAEKEGRDPVLVFAEFARKVHARHPAPDARHVFGRYVALMASLSPDQWSATPTSKETP